MIVKWKPLLKEITDKVVQEDLYKLKLFLEQFDFTTEGIKGDDGAQGDPGPSGPVGPSATTVPRLTDVFDTDLATAVGDLVVVSGTNFVSTIADNANLTIPFGIFGLALSKPTTTTVEVIFMGLIAGFVGFTPGQPLFVSTSGVPTHTKPVTGTVQQIGFATRTNEFFLQIRQHMRQI